MRTPLADRPLLDTRTDAQLFVDRTEELETLRRAVHQGLNSLVVGPRGVGKTSALRQVAYKLRNDNMTVAFVDGRVVDDVEGLLRLVRSQIGHALGPTTEPARILPVSDGPGRLLDLVRDLPAPGRDDEVVVIVDNVDPAVGHALFGRLRDELWQRPVTWVVAADENDRAGFLTPPADAFFDPVVTLGPLDFDASLSLLRSRLAGTEDLDMLQAVVAAAGADTPRGLLALARQVVLSGRDPASARAAREDRAVRLAGLGRAATMLTAELETLGPVSASDPRLLGRMGWTRSRATQVLKILEEAGLVHASRGVGDTARQLLYSVTDAP